MKCVIFLLAFTVSSLSLATPKRTTFGEFLMQKIEVSQFNISSLGKALGMRQSFYHYSSGNVLPKYGTMTKMLGNGIAAKLKFTDDDLDRFIELWKKERGDVKEHKLAELDKIVTNIKSGKTIVVEEAQEAETFGEFLRQKIETNWSSTMVILIEELDIPPTTFSKYIIVNSNSSYRPPGYMNMTKMLENGIADKLKFTDDDLDMFIKLWKKEMVNVKGHKLAELDKLVDDIKTRETTVIIRGTPEEQARQRLEQQRREEKLVWQDIKDYVEMGKPSIMGISEAISEAISESEVVGEKNLLLEQLEQTLSDIANREIGIESGRLEQHLLREIVLSADEYVELCVFTTLRCGGKEELMLAVERVLAVHRQNVAEYGFASYLDQVTSDADLEQSMRELFDSAVKVYNSIELVQPVDQELNKAAIEKD